MRNIWECSLTQTNCKVCKSGQLLSLRQNNCQQYLPITHDDEMTWNLANALFKSLDFVCSFIHFSKVLVFGTISPEALYSTALGLN